MIRVPLHNRSGDVVAHLTVDDEDADLATRYRWGVNANGYAWRSIMGGKRHVYFHREMLGLERGDPRQADHVNRDRLDNRRANARVATPSQNAQNKPSLGGTSAFRGVHWDRNRSKWAASVQLAGRCHHLGRFDDEQDAARAVAAFRRVHMPFSDEAAA